MDIVGKQVHLYGDAEVKYGSIQLKADYIRIDWTTNELFAKGTYDSTTKKTIGEPIFQDGPESYTTRELRYNYKTKKGFIRGVVTQQGDGNIRGDKVKKDDEGNLYIKGAIYTTCNLTHPHFYINAPKIKLIDNKQVVSGPFNLVIADVPLPLGLPFGFFPFPKKKEIGPPRWRLLLCRQRAFQRHRYRANLLHRKLGARRKLNLHQALPLQWQRGSALQPQQIGRRARQTA